MIVNSELSKFEHNYILKLLQEMLLSPLHLHGLLSDEIAMDMMGGMMQSIDNNGVHLESNKDKMP